MIFLIIWKSIKKWVILVGGAIIFFVSTYLFGLLKGRKQEKEKYTNEAIKEQAQANEEAQATYNQAEQAVQDITPPKTPDVEKRDDLDTNH